MKTEEFKRVFIETEYIRADSLLKLAACAASGGEAKVMIKNGLVRVNGDICTERGKKLYAGDLLETNGKKIIPVKDTN
ncbi:MAG: RNA-binding S4 domain-containing protein [Oscillospiraceae bacterium]|nr:RNA-binding S4 domain-containing protein [Oscillospiraceae bacterium]